MFGCGENRALGLADEENHCLPTRVEALPTSMALTDMALGGDPDGDFGEKSGWSVVMMKGGGIVGGSLYRWGLLGVFNGVDPVDDGGLSEGSPVVAWLL